MNKIALQGAVVGALLVAAAPAAADDPAIRLASLTPTAAAGETGKARVLDLGGLQLEKPEGAQLLEIGYEIHIGGIKLATVNLASLVQDGRYLAATMLETKGLAEAFASSDIQVLSTGQVHNRLVIPTTYNSDQVTPEKRQLVGLTYAESGIAVDSNPLYDLDRFPVPAEQQRQTVDPLSAAMFIVLGSSVTESEKCGGVVPIFDGRRRYSLKFKYIEDDEISLGRDSFNKGKPIQALHCLVSYERLAGFKPPKNGKATEIPPLDVWLAHFEGTDFMVPIRLQADTGFGGVVARAIHVKALGPSDRS